MTKQSWELIVITGASRGFGRSFAVSYASRDVSNTVKDNAIHSLHFVLTGRSIDELYVTRSLILESREAVLNRTSGITVSEYGTIVDIIHTDLVSNDLPGIAIALFDNPIKRNPSNEYNKILFINNAASVGPLQNIGTGETLTQISYAIDLNIKASIFLSSEVVARYSAKKFSNTIQTIEIVNISSLGALIGFESWAYYCAGKAARDMFHKVLALEHPDDVIKVLNYAPGPLDTKMQKEIRECMTVKAETREYYASLKEQNKLVDPFVSANKLIRILEKGTYESGCHIDYYDFIEGVDKHLEIVENVDRGSCCCSETTTNERKACECTVCECGSECKCPPDCVGKKATEPQFVPSCRAASVCTCGPTCNCKELGRPCCDACKSFVNDLNNAASTVDICDCKICGCESECKCPSDCTGKEVAEPQFVPSCRAASVCTCGPTCNCKELGRPCCDACTSFINNLSKAAVTASSGCGKPGCSCGPSCTCDESCTCGAVQSSAEKSVCGSESCGCGSACKCGSDCSCGKT